MSDLHALLHEPWCPDGPQPAMPWKPDELPKDVRICMPLFQRLPECVPEGLEWRGVAASRMRRSVGEDWRNGWVLNDQPFTDAQAELMFIGQAVKNGYEICRDEATRPARWECLYMMSGHKNVFATAPTIPAAIVACMHKVGDEREAGSREVWAPALPATGSASRLHPRDPGVD